jgi:tetratricopeptide (TPR) repeat protein
MPEGFSSMKISKSSPLIVAVIYLLILAPTAQAQDAFDTTATVIRGTYVSGTRTTSGCDAFDSSVPAGTYDAFDTTEPEPEAQSFEDGTFTENQYKLRRVLIPPVACEEPEPPGMFPLLPQCPVLPIVDIENDESGASNSRDKKEASARFDAGKKFAKDGKLQNAAEEFDQAIEFATDEMQMRQAVADHLTKLSAHNDSRRKREFQTNLLRLAVFFNPLNLGVREKLGQCLKVAGYDPSDAEYRVSLAEQLEGLGSYRLAVAEWYAVIKLRHSYSDHARLAGALSAAGHDREAVSELRRAVASHWPEAVRSARSECHLKLAEIFYKQSHEFEKSGGDATRIALLENGLMDARRAVILNPRNKAATKLFLSVSKEALSLRPDEIDNHMMLAGAYMLKGDLRAADREYKTCNSIDNLDPRLPVAKIVHKCVSGNPSLIVNGGVADGVARVKEILETEPKNVQLWRFLGRLYAQSSDTEQAQACFKEAHDLYFSGE